MKDSPVPLATIVVPQSESPADTPTDTSHLGEGTETPNMAEFSTPTSKRRCLRPRQDMEDSPLNSTPGDPIDQQITISPPSRETHYTMNESTPVRYKRPRTEEPRGLPSREFFATPTHTTTCTEKSTQQVLPDITTENQDILTMLDSTPKFTKMKLRKRGKDSELLDLSLSTVSSNESNSDSEYVPTPLRPILYEVEPCTVPPDNKLFIGDLNQLGNLIRDINKSRSCATAQCDGKLVLIFITSEFLGGSVSVSYACDGCKRQAAFFDSQYRHGNTSTISKAVQVAFILSGSTHATYYKTLQLSLGINAVTGDSFIRTIKNMYPVAKQMVEDLCRDEMEIMKSMDQAVLGSWSRAVTTADGAWMTRGRHSKNFTYSVRNYMTGGLLWRIHLSQKGRDSLVQEPLYQGTSKAAEGYATRRAFNELKSLGMNVEINWQDSDSSSSKAVCEVFPKAKAMVCGGHGARAHLKHLEGLSSKKSFSKALQDRHKKQFPKVQTAKCHCEKSHKAGCGCMSKAFIEQSRNNFSQILSQSKSAAEFERRLRALSYHARDIHEWEGGECEFHGKTVCSCGDCQDRNKHKCSGTPYRTRMPLKCPFHSLAYEIDIDRRASKAEEFVHPEMLRGHSNWLEASHNVFIRFRSKDISLERLHYHLSTDLALLQANMTQARKMKGPKYHWRTDLFRKMDLPVFDGVQQALEKHGLKRQKSLEKSKQSPAKRRRIERKIARKREQAARKLWSQRHGGDTYGEEDSEHEEDTKTKKCKWCGSSTHTRLTSMDCPYNKAKAHSPVTRPLDPDVTTLEQSDPQASSESEDESSDESFIETDVAFSDNEESRTCGTKTAHRTDSPLNSSNLYNKGKKLFSPKIISASQFKVGDYCFLHREFMPTEKHLTCRVVQKTKRYRLYCKQGILSSTFSSMEMAPCFKSNGNAISLEKWRQSDTIDLKNIQEESLDDCKCKKPQPTTTIGDTITVEDDNKPDQLVMWIQNPLYNLSSEDRESIERPDGWLTDAVITASQLLMLQEFPAMGGLQPPTLQQVRGYKANSGPFVQIIHIGNNHWSVASNIDCPNGTIRLYDTLHKKPSPSTVQVLADLVLPSGPALTIQVMDVQRQSDGNVCGVLAIAIAYSICSQKNVIDVTFDEKRSRNHLKNCLEHSAITQFPEKGKRRSKGQISSKEYELHCTCKMPEDEEGNEKWAECESCERWFHKHCLDIPDEVFEQKNTAWICKDCM